MTTRSLVADGIVGFWLTSSFEREEPGSVVAIYPYQGKYYGKIIAIYDKAGTITESIYHPVRRASAMVGDPFLCGLDIVFNASPKEDGTYKGKVVDPRDGQVYRAELWRKGNNLVLRGKFFVFGKNVTWAPFPDSEFNPIFKKPDLSAFAPDTPGSKP